MTRNVSIMGAADYRHGEHSIPMAVMFAFWGRHIFDAPAGVVGIGYAADPGQRAPLVARFRRLADEWIEATENMSSIDDMVVHPAYLEIIGMGPSAIPPLLDELATHTAPLVSCVGCGVRRANPVDPDAAGDLEKMADAWMQWARENSYR